METDSAIIFLQSDSVTLFTQFIIQIKHCLRAVTATVGLVIIIGTNSIAAGPIRAHSHGDGVPGPRIYRLNIIRGPSFMCLVGRILNHDLVEMLQVVLLQVSGSNQAAAAAAASSQVTSKFKMLLSSS